MATSGTYAFTLTRDACLSAAFRKINRLGDFETIDSTRTTTGLAALDPVIKSLMGLGMPLWAMTETTIALSLFTTVSPVLIGIGQTVNSVAPIRVVQALRKDNLTGVDVPLNIYTYEDYERLSVKASTGTPVHLFYQPTGASGTMGGRLLLWSLPDTYWKTNGSLYIRYQRPFQDAGATGALELDFPPEWDQAVIYSLAYALAPEYGIDITMRQALKADRDEYLQMALSNQTEEGSLFFQPSRIWQ